MNSQRDSSPFVAESIITSARQNLNPSTSKTDEQFLQEPTLAFLESYQNHLKPSLASGIFVFALPKLQLNSIGDIGQFKHIQICDLSSNFIQTIDSLVLNCRQLIKLDLHSNRVRYLTHNSRFSKCLFSSSLDQPITRWSILERVIAIKSCLST